MEENHRNHPVDRLRFSDILQGPLTILQISIGYPLDSRYPKCALDRLFFSAADVH